MRFYDCQKQFVCGVDLHARNLYLCLMDREQKVLVHRPLENQNTELLLKILSPYQTQLVVAAESCFAWYWLADFCAQHKIEFQLGHALYMKAIHGGKVKNDRIDALKIAKLTLAGMLPSAYVYPQTHRSLRDLLRRRLYFVHQRAELMTHTQLANYQVNLPDLGRVTKTKIEENTILPRFEDDCQQKSVELNLQTIAHYNQMIVKLEWYIFQHTQQAHPQELSILMSIKGIGRILAQTIILEIDKIERFPAVQNFISYSRLVKCSHESSGKKYGVGGAKIGNPYLKHAFSEASVFMAKFNPKIGERLEKLEQRHGKSKGKSILAAKIGRAVYMMLKHKRVFDEKRFLSN